MPPGHLTTSTLLRFSLGCVLVAGLTSTKLGAIVPISQARSTSGQVSATVPPNSDSDSDSDAAPDFNLFSSTVSPVASAASAGQDASSQAFANQTSLLGGGTILADGSAEVILFLEAGPGNASASGDASSLFQFTFSLGEQNLYGLSGSVSTVPTFTGGGTPPVVTSDILFENLSTPGVVFQTLTNNEIFGFVGALDPGTYRVTVSTVISASQSSDPTVNRTVNATGRYHFDLSVTPVPEIPSRAGAIGMIALSALGCWRRSRRIAAG